MTMFLFVCMFMHESFLFVFLSQIFIQVLITLNFCDMWSYCLSVSMFFTWLCVWVGGWVHNP